MLKIKTFLKNEFIVGKTKTNWLFLVLGIMMQVAGVVYGYVTGTPDNVLSIISAFAGVISVVLCAEGKISFYVFGYIQLLTYTFGIAIPNHLYGEIYENIFYFVTMIIGTYIWIKNYRIKDGKGANIAAKKLSTVGNIVMYSVMIIGTIILAFVLRGTDDPQPFFDAITTVPAFIAQIMLMFGYREQWVGWLIEDVTSVIMFILIGNWMMVAQYLFWTINCVYGWIEWTKHSTENV